MITVTRHRSPESWLSLDPAEEFTLLSSGEWARLGPPYHLTALREGRVCARCSVWTNSLPEYEGSRPGAIGHFRATDAEAGAAVLRAALDTLADVRVRRAVGPLDGNTWNHYRSVVDRGTRPPFFLEPWDSPGESESWRKAGFRPLGDFHSTALPPQIEDDPRLVRAKRRLEKGGVRIRNLNRNSFEEDLRAIHAVSAVAFAPNLLYTPSAPADLLRSYEPMRARIDPAFVWLAEVEARPVGFVFAIPDLAQAGRGEPVDTLIIKTLAILPDRAFAGLGQWLTRLAHRRAHESGYRSVVHALMHGGSRIKHFGKDAATVIRRYTLFEREP